MKSPPHQPPDPGGFSLPDFSLPVSDSAAAAHTARALELAALIDQHADYADHERHLHPAVAQAFAAAGLYRLAAPRSVQGADAGAVSQIAVLEAVSRIDASSGWNLMIGMETFGLLAPAMGACAELIADPLTVMAGSTAAVGRAVREGDGYRISGRWQFASGVHNAQLFGATVQIYEGDSKLDAPPCYALIQLPHFTIVDTWHTVGMRGSGSHDVLVEGVWVPEHHLCPTIGRVQGDSVNMHFPRGARLAYNKVGVALGIFRAALDEFTAIARGKHPRFSSKTMRERPNVQRTLAEAEARYLGIRAATYTLVQELWNGVAARERPSAAQLARFQAVCSDAANTAAEQVHALAGAAGTSANVADSRLARIARDATVVRQHVTVAVHHMEDAGRLLLGLEPQDTMLRGIPPEA